MRRSKFIWKMEFAKVLGMKSGILVFIISFLVIPYYAQTSRINRSSFSGGFGFSSSASFDVTSSSGQSFVGISSNSSSQIRSGFLSILRDDITPVELAGFTSSVNENNVILKWQTATEINNSGFDIERLQNSKIESLKDLTDGKAGWVKIGSVEGKGTTSEIQNYSFIDKSLGVGIYSYRIKQIDFDGSYKYFSLTEDIEISAPVEFELSQNYPNPFNPATKINFNLPANSKVVLKIYNMLGEEVVTLINGDIESGYHTIDFNATELNSGVYFYSLRAKAVAPANGTSSTDFVSTKKMLVIK